MVLTVAEHKRAQLRVITVPARGVMGIGRVRVKVEVRSAALVIKQKGPPGNGAERKRARLRVMMVQPRGVTANGRVLVLTATIRVRQRVQRVRV